MTKAMQFWVSRGFNIEHTGGNCEAFRLDYEDGSGRYILITLADDPSIPETTDQKLIVCLYDNDDSNDAIAFSFASNSEDAEAALLQLMAHNDAWMTAGAQPNTATNA